MSLRRWSVLVVWVSLSLVLSLSSLVFYFLTPPAQRPPGAGVPSVLQLCEVAIAVGLLWRAEWAYDWAVVWYLAKAVSAVGMAIGLAIGGQRDAVPVILVVGALFYAGLTLFLYRSREFFD
jgi:hypothetical protein